jgi:hypothetical protein
MELSVSLELIKDFLSPVSQLEKGKLFQIIIYNLLLIIIPNF